MSTDDITPGYHPVALLRQALEQAEDAQACVVVIVSKDGTLWFDSCGHERQAVNWALDVMHDRLMRSVGEE